MYGLSQGIIPSGVLHQCFINKKIIDLILQLRPEIPSINKLDSKAVEEFIISINNIYYFRILFTLNNISISCESFSGNLAGEANCFDFRQPFHFLL